MKGIPRDLTLDHGVLRMTLLSLVLFIVGWPAQGLAQPPENLQAKYFSGLRERGLYQLAEDYARQQLRRDDLLATERLELTIELSRTLADHAAHAADSREQARLWAEARRILQKRLESNPPQRLFVKFQAAALDALQGRSLRYQVQLAPHDRVIRQRATELLNRSVSSLRDLRSQINQERQAISERPAETAQYSIAELDGLDERSREREASVLVDLGIIMPPDSPDRADALIVAENLLRKLPQLKYLPTTGRAGENHLLLARCLRLRGNHTSALEVLALFSKPGQSASLQNRATAERIRTHLNMGRAEQAAGVIDEVLVSGQSLTEELSYLNVEILAHQWNQAAKESPPAVAERLLKQLHERADKVRRETGGYWGARAWATWEFAQESAELGPELAGIIRTARAWYAHQKITAAIEEYATAASAAFRAGRPDLAFDLAFTRASLQLRAKQFAAAENSLAELVNRFPENPRAAQTSLLRAYALGQVYNKQRSKSRREAYTDALEEHRRRFAGDLTAASATWMLAQLQEQRLQFSVALQLYQSIPADHKRHADAQIAIARCYEQILSRLRALKQRDQDWRERAIKDLTAYLPNRTVPLPSLSESQSGVATYLARIYLIADQPDFAEADELLEWVFQSRPPPRTSTLTDRMRRTLARAGQLRVVSLAGQRKPDEAAKMLDQLSETEPAEMLRILDGLSQLVDVAGGDVGRDLGRLQLQAVEKLQPRRDELTPTQARRLDQCRAQAYVATGRIDDAVKLYDSLRKSAPRDRSLKTAHAEVLLACGTRRCLNQARVLWRELEGSYKSGSKAWLNARFHRALCALELKDYDVCYKLLGIADKLYPDWGGPELQAQAAELLDKCESLREKNGTPPP